MREIEFDLPYEKNILFIEEIKKEKGLTHQEATVVDYNENWKEKRRKFQLSTKCMTSMIERICFPLKGEFEKIIIECVGKKNYSGYKNLLGVCTVQVEINCDEFFRLTDREKKKRILGIIVDVMKGTAELEVYFPAIEKAISLISQNNYRNEWYWKKSVSSGNRKFKICVLHEIEDVQIQFVIFENTKEIFRKCVIKTLPHEYAYGMYLGKIGWKSSNEVYLITKGGERFTVLLNQ